MERIIVSENFRLSKTNSSFDMKFSEKIEMRKAYEAMEAAVMAIVNENGYYAIWLQDLADCCEAESFSVESSLECMEFVDYLPAMCKAVAEAFPTVNFEAHAEYDDQRCYWMDEYDVTFSDGHLSITETFEDDECGYFCPECGSWVAPCGDGWFDSDEVTCEDCDEVIKVSDLKYVPPTVTKSEYDIK